jgi:hypothetical protein
LCRQHTSCIRGWRDSTRVLSCSTSRLIN